MPKIPGVPHLRAVRALEKAGFRIARDVAKKLIEARAEREQIPPLTSSSKRQDYTIVVGA